MMISIASGKGGTGKTMVAVNLALALEGAQLLDCDVENPNDHLFLNPELRETKPVNLKVPRIGEKCDYCGKCSEFCEFNAIFVLKPKKDIPGNILIFPELCHGCGGCAMICPQNSIVEEDRQIGAVKKGAAGEIDLVWGELYVGEPLAVPVIKAVKKEIRGKTVIIDSPPGTSCPVINSIYGSDYCVLVTEPTPFGLYDLELAVETLRELKIPFGVIVNKKGIGDEKVYEYCKKEKIEVLLEIPFDRRIAELYSRGVPFATTQEWKRTFSNMYERMVAGIEDG
jgi:MinD superfamily P-loop ATPase